MDKENTIYKTKLLLVEGNHDKDFFQAWLQKLGIDEIQVMQYEGKTKLNNYFVPLVKQSAFPSVTSLVVVRDADDNPNGAFQSVSHTLAKNGLPIPPAAWILRQDKKPKTGIVLMPRPNATGALEELLMETVQSDPLAEKAHKYIQNAVETLNANNTRKPPPVHRCGKAKTHAYLATFEEPDKDPGKAAWAGYWDFSHPALEPLLQILRQM